MKNILTHKGFIGSVKYSAKDGVFYGKIKGINDLVTYEGTTVDELENAFKEMVELHIGDCKMIEKIDKAVKEAREGNTVSMKPGESLDEFLDRVE